MARGKRVSKAEPALAPRLIECENEIARLLQEDYRETEEADKAWRASPERASWSRSPGQRPVSVLNDAAPRTASMRVRNERLDELHQEQRQLRERIIEAACTSAIRRRDGAKRGKSNKRASLKVLVALLQVLKENPSLAPGDRAVRGKVRIRVDSLGWDRSELGETTLGEHLKHWREELATSHLKV